jgi:hypothetical protein
MRPDEAESEAETESVASPTPQLGLIQLRLDSSWSPIYHLAFSAPLSSILTIQVLVKQQIKMASSVSTLSPQRLQTKLVI